MNIKFRIHFFYIKKYIYIKNMETQGPALEIYSSRILKHYLNGRTNFEVE